MKLQPEAMIQTYIYPLFMAKNEKELISSMCWGSVVLVVASLILQDSSPDTRRTSRTSSRFFIPGRVAKFLEECPAFFIPMVLVMCGKQRTYNSVVNQLCLGMFVMHFFQRCFISPLLMTSQKPTPLLPFLLAFLTHAYNGILHGLYFVNYYRYNDDEWFYKPSFYIGFVVFLYGMKTNIGADSVLRKLELGNQNHFKVPTGGWFEKISCPHYFGEIIQMWGYALTSLAPPAFILAATTTLLLARQALQCHQWYLKKFEDYPRTRKAVFPFLL